jgi:hypothetical protein
LPGFLHIGPIVVPFLPGRAVRVHA